MEKYVVKDISQVLLQGKSALPNALRAVETSMDDGADSCWQLLCVAYALGYHELLMPLCRLLRQGLLRQPSAVVPEGLQTLLEQGFRRQDVMAALHDHGISRRTLTNDGVLPAEITQYHVELAAVGYLAFTLRCPSCSQAMTFNLRSDVIADNRVNCVACFSGLSIDLPSLRNAAKRGLLDFTESLQGAPLKDQTQRDLLLAATMLLRGYLDIYFVRLRAERIGHLILNTALFLTELQRDNRLDSTLTFAFPNDSRHVANPYLLQFWSQLVHFGPWVEHVFTHCQKNRAFQELAIDLYNPPLHLACDLNGMLDQYHLPLHFTETEHRMASLAMVSMGLPPGAKHVCVLGRDDTYLNKHLPGASDRWNYHSYRNVQIENYLPALRWISAQGFYSLRMGHLVESPIESDDPRIIEYATHHRTPFMDIYLASTCMFYLSCMTGPDLMPLVMDRPLLLVNVPQYNSLHFFGDRRVLVAFKKPYCHSSGRFLSLEEVLQRGLGNIGSAQEAVDAGITLEEHSPEEIQAIVEEMASRCAGTWIESEKEAQIQRQFKEILGRYSPTERIVRARISMAFLRTNPSFLPLERSLHGEAQAGDPSPPAGLMSRPCS